MFLGMVLNSKGLDIAEEEEYIFVFTISLLDTTIQDGSTRERSNTCDIILILTLDSKIENKTKIKVKIRRKIK